MNRHYTNMKSNYKLNLNSKKIDKFKSSVKLILGGVKSGKSQFAEELALRYKKVFYVATNVFFDKEMKQRIIEHKKRRPNYWETIEEGYDLIKALRNADKNECYIIDCITIYLSNLLLKLKSTEQVINHIQTLIEFIKKKNSIFIFVSNEVGLSVINKNKLARQFCEISGIVNQMLAGISDEVYFCAAGIANKIK